MHEVQFWGQESSSYLSDQRVSCLWLKKREREGGISTSALGWNMDAQGIICFARRQTLWSGSSLSPQNWIACIITSQDSVLAGGLSIKKEESYYFHFYHNSTLNYFSQNKITINYNFASFQFQFLLALRLWDLPLYLLSWLFDRLQW